jgi:hypothetical protein
LTIGHSLGEVTHSLLEAEAIVKVICLVCLLVRGAYGADCAGFHLAIAGGIRSADYGNLEVLLVTDGR